MDAVCITTWISGDYTKGTARIEYAIVGVAKKHPNALNWGRRIYSTAEGARRAARRQGLTVLPGVAQGHEAARRKLGMPPSAEFQTRAMRHCAVPHHSHKFRSDEFVQSFAA